MKNPCRLLSLIFLATVVSASAAHYQVYLLGGQSNGNGRADAAQLVPPLSEVQTDVRLYYRNTQDSNSVLPEDQWINLAPGSGHGTTLYYATEFGPEVSFGRAMADAKPAENIAIIKYTHGGTSLSSNWSATGTQYATFVSTVQDGLAALTTAGHTYVLRGMLWQQGESDTGGSAADNYQTNLTNLIARVRTDLNGGAVFPFVIGSLSDSQYSNITTVGSGPYKVRQAQEAVAAADVTVGIAISDGYGIQTDGIHFDHNGQVALGQNHAVQMLALEGPGETEPQLSGTTPANGVLTTPVDSNLVAAFNQPIQLKDGGTVTIRDLGPGGDTVITIPDARISASENQLIINPATDLIAGNPYAVRISATAVEDLAGNPFVGVNDDTTWYFTTASENSPPQVISFSPADGDLGVAPNANLVITFDEPVAKGAAGDIVLKFDGTAIFETIPVTDSRVSVSGSVVTINPTGTLSPHGYHVQIAPGAIQDLDGAPWEGIASTDATTWNFTVAMVAAATGVFDENVDATNTIDVQILPGTLAPFQTAVQTAFNNELGGIIDWETGSTVRPSNTTDPRNNFINVDATYGAGASNSLRVTFDRSMDLYTNNINSQVQVLSRQGTWQNAIIPGGGNIASGLEYNMTFNGAPVIEIGAAMPSRSTYALNGVTAVNFRATVTYSSSAPVTQDFTVGGVPGTGDTFLHFAAPDGQTITGFGVKWISETGGTLADGQRRPTLDDLGFVLAAPANTYAAWIDGYFPGVTDPAIIGLGADPDGDGIGNGVENYFGSHPGEFSQGLVSATVAGNSFTFTHPLNDSPASDLTAGYRWSKDLASFHADGASHEGTTVTFSQGTPSGGMVTVTATITGTPIDRLFVDLEVTRN